MDRYGLKKKEITLASVSSITMCDITKVNLAKQDALVYLKNLENLNLNFKELFIHEFWIHVKAMNLKFIKRAFAIL